MNKENIYKRQLTAGLSLSPISLAGTKLLFQSKPRRPITSSMEIISNPIKLLPLSINHHYSVHHLLPLLFSRHGCWWPKMPNRNPDLSHRPSGSSKIMKLRKHNSQVSLKLRLRVSNFETWVVEEEKLLV